MTIIEPIIAGVCLYIVIKLTIHSITTEIKNRIDKLEQEIKKIK